ncbi:MAG: hypothetical protein H6704_15220 [Myxococcales bacterium]|nr:hypothetical protein [Myxococcales bacterium]
MLSRSLAPALAAALLAATPVAAQKPQQLAGGPVEAPYSLTAADGTGLKLVALEARAVVDGPLAFTELHLTFQNPQPRTIEGHFKVTMPDGAAISRFAMKIGDKWMEGEVVEKQAARRAYEDALHRKQDPALLEQDAGNSFRARVFPIPANGQKELIIAWSHQLVAQGEAYRLPLAGLPTVDRLTLTALTAAPKGAAGPQTSLGGETSRYQVTKVDKKSWKPEQDWVVFGGALPADGDALRAGNLAVVRFVVPGGDTPEDLKSAVILFDTSASRAIGFAQRLEALEALVRKLADIGITQVEVIAFDQYTESVYSGAPSGFGAKHRERLTGRHALGASDLGAALDAVAQTKGAGRRLVVLTDGVATAGAQERDALEPKVKALRAAGIERVDAIVDTTARDPATLALLVTGELPRPGQVIEGRAPLAEQVARLGRKALGDITVTVPGAEWVQPGTLRGLQGGDAAVVFADLPAGRDLAVELSGGAKATVKPNARDAEEPLLKRAWVNARIDRLLEMRSTADPDLKEALKHQIIALSTRERVLSPFTALVVLETENDYRRFGIDRTALADILVVGPTGVELMHRDPSMLALAPPPPPPPPRPRPVPQKARRATRGAPGDGAMAGAPAPAAAPMEREEMAKKADEGEMAEAPAEEDGDDFAGAPAGRVAAADAPAADPAPAEPMAEAKTEVADEEAPARPRSRRRPDRRPQPFPATATPPPPPPAPQQIAARPTGESEGRRELAEIQKGSPALTGQMAEIERDLARGRVKKALGASWTWRDDEPADLLALVALGQSLAHSGNGLDAARAFGSVLDLYPSRADMRRLAGNWLERLGEPGLRLAADTYAVALSQRPDHPSIYHLLAMTQLRLGRYEDALETALTGITARRASGRFEAVERILQEDAQIIAAAWVAADAGAKETVEKKLARFNLRIDDAPTMRFVLTWETDANDVDFHIFDGDFNHAYYSRRQLATGGELYADITTGYGPECFTIHGPQAFPYLLKAHYYSRGPMGYGAGKVQIIRHDGKGRVGFEDRPFVIMQDGAYVDLGRVSNADAKPAPPPKVAARLAR